MKRVAMVAAVLLACPDRGRLGPEDGHRVFNGATAKSDVRITSQGDLKPTEEMWFYEQAMREYENPKMAVRQCGGTPRPAATTTPGGHGMVRAVECTSTGEFRSVPRRLCARLGLQQPLLPLSLDQQPRTVIVVPSNPDQYARSAPLR